MNISKEKVIGAFIWKVTEKIGTKGVQFVIQIVLARLLFPEDYGILAILTVFISLSNILIQTGFNTALIQKKEADDLDFSSVFWAGFAIAAGLYMILFFSAPYIAGFYRESDLTTLLRVLALVLFPGAMNSVQYAYVSRNLQFKRYSLCCILASIVSGAAGIGFASRGFGVWALVFQQILANILSALMLWIVVEWKPKRVFSLQRVQMLFGFGWKLMVSSLLNTGYIDALNLMIGKVFNSESLGLYNRGNQYPQFIVSNINESIQSVMLPVLSKCQDNREQVKRIMRKSMLISACVIFPMMFGLLAVAKTVVLLTLTEKWIAVVPYFQLSCLLYLFHPVHTANIQTWNALGRSDLFLKLELIKKTVEILFLFFTVPFGIKAMLTGQIASSVIALYLNSVPNRKLIQYGFLEQMKDMIPALLSAIGMMLIVLAVGRLECGLAVGLFLQIFSGIAAYILLGVIFKNEGLLLLLNMMLDLRKKFVVR